MAQPDYHYYQSAIFIFFILPHIIKYALNISNEITRTHIAQLENHPSHRGILPRSILTLYYLPTCTRYLRPCMPSTPLAIAGNLLWCISMVCGVYSSVVEGTYKCELRLSI